MSVKLAVAVVIGLVLLFVSGSLQAFGSSRVAEEPLFDARMQGCFSRAMVGMDSVINARVGVPAEHALDLAALETAGDQPVVLVGEPGFDEPLFDQPLLVTILAAYLWENSPHEYAIKVFYECAASPPIVADAR